MERPKLEIIRIEGEESQLKTPENIFNKIIDKNFPNLKKDMPIKVREPYKTPNRLEQKRKSLHHKIKHKTYRIKKEY